MSTLAEPTPPSVVMIIVIIVHNVIEYTVVMYNFSFYCCISFALCAVFTEVFVEY